MLFPFQMEEIARISLQGCCSWAPSCVFWSGLLWSYMPGVKGTDYRLQWLYLLLEVMDQFRPSVTPRVTWVPLVHLATLSIAYCKSGRSPYCKAALQLGFSNCHNRLSAILVGGAFSPADQHTVKSAAVWLLETERVGQHDACWPGSARPVTPGRVSLCQLTATCISTAAIRTGEGVRISQSAASLYFGQSRFLTKHR